MQIADPTALTTGGERRVVVAGGGYAGVTLASTLADRMRDADGIEIVLVDPKPYQQALSELDLVAAGTPRPQFAELWHGQIFAEKPVTIVYDRLDSIDLDARRVTVGPAGGPTTAIPYWRLVIATGAVPRLPPVPGLEEHAVTVWSVNDAMELQQRLEKALEAAACTPEPEMRRCELAVTVVGGGATGIEIMGTIAAVLPKHVARLGYKPQDLALTLLEGSDDILHDLVPSQREKARARLESLGVQIVTGELLAEATESAVRTTAGREIPTSVLVWCGGARADPDAADWGLDVSPNGRLITTDRQKAVGRDDIYVVGDVAEFRDGAHPHGLPMLAQFAIQGAEHAAESILSETRGKPLVPYEPNMHGEFVSVGPDWGIGWMLKLRISGRFAIFMKRLTYVLYWMQVGSYRLARLRTRQMLGMHRQ